MSKYWKKTNYYFCKSLSYHLFYGLVFMFNSQHKKVYYCATTGRASLVLSKTKGQTLHSFLGCGDLHLPLSTLKHHLKNNEIYQQARRRISTADVVGVDEVSMMSAYVISVFNEVCQHVRGNTMPFGGIQVFIYLCNNHDNYTFTTSKKVSRP